MRHRQIKSVVVSLACLLNVVSASAAEPTASEQFTALLQDAWEYRLREDPLFATETGDHRFDEQLPKASLADEQRRNAESLKFLKRLEAIKREELPPNHQANYDIFGKNLRE